MEDEQCPPPQVRLYVENWQIAALLLLVTIPLVLLWIGGGAITGVLLLIGLVLAGIGMPILTAAVAWFRERGQYDTPQTANWQIAAVALALLWPLLMLWIGWVSVPVVLVGLPVLAGAIGWVRARL